MDNVLLSVLVVTLHFLTELDFARNSKFKQNFQFKKYCAVCVEMITFICTKMLKNKLKTKIRDNFSYLILFFPNNVEIQLFVMCLFNLAKSRNVPLEVKMAAR